MPLRQVGERAAAPSDRSAESSPAHEAASDEQPFNFRGLFPELKRLTIAHMDHETRQNFKLTSRENYATATAVEKVARNVAVKEAETTAADIYDTLLPGRLPNVSWQETDPRIMGDGYDPTKVSADDIASKVGRLAKRLDDGRQADFTEKLAQVDSNVQAECLAALAPNFGGFRQPYRSQLLGQAVELLGSDDHNTRQDAAQAIAKAEAQGLLRSEHEARIKEICERSPAARMILEHCREVESRENWDARQFLQYAKAIQNNPAEQVRILGMAVASVDVDLRSGNRRMETYRRSQNQSERALDRERTRGGPGGIGL